ncbi:hypothetical protein CPB83DRAFT_900699 [Crepidotus variabilis]|uniref:Restriction of telomere capping protein 4 C-terminal domain-containing protein n=1 Tax=Crepidotus variabilis TaxID=179855 RepID=A0A9P6E126_9AGAR|nr:hypothetical protein CPB83DRAFT_900699 [Crepidotus variabilis]
MSLATDYKTSGIQRIDYFGTICPGYYGIAGAELILQMVFSHLVKSQALLPFQLGKTLEKLIRANTNWPVDNFWALTAGRHFTVELFQVYVIIPMVVNALIAEDFHHIEGWTPEQADDFCWDSLQFGQLYMTTNDPKRENRVEKIKEQIMKNATAAKNQHQTAAPTQPPIDEPPVLQQDPTPGSSDEPSSKSNTQANAREGTKEPTKAPESPGGNKKVPKTKRKRKDLQTKATSAALDGPDVDDQVDLAAQEAAQQPQKKRKIDPCPVGKAKQDAEKDKRANTAGPVSEETTNAVRRNPRRGKGKAAPALSDPQEKTPVAPSAGPSPAVETSKNLPSNQDTEQPAVSPKGSAKGAIKRKPLDKDDAEVSPPKKSCSTPAPSAPAPSAPAPLAPLGIITRNGMRVIQAAEDSE